MRIYVNHDYRGARTGLQIIPKGEYDADDPQLYGLAQYLVENGHARVTEDDPPQTETSAGDAETTVTEVGFEPIPTTRAVRRRGK